MFGVRGAESFQAEYQRLVEVWLRRITDLEERLDRASQNPEKSSETVGQLEQSKITISDHKGNVLYDETQDKKVCSISPEQMQQLEEALTSEVGEIVEGLPSFKVEVNGETFFESSSEKIVVNKKLVESAPAIEGDVKVFLSENGESEYDDYYDEQSDSDNYSQEPESEEVQLPLEQNDALTNALVEMMVPIIEALPVVEEPTPSLQKEEDLFFEPSETLTQKLPPIQKEEKLSTKVGIPTQDTSVLLPQKSGIDAVQEALGEMKEGSLKSLLQGMTTDMQATGAQQLPNPAMDTLLSERTFDKTNPQWWQQLGNKLDAMVTMVRENFIQHRAASTLKDLANRMALQPGDSFEGADYNLSRVGKDYTLTDKQGNELMKFQPSPLGVKVDQSLPALDDSHFNKTEQLRQDFKEGRSPGGSFMSQGAAEAKNIKRINTITQALSQYAMAQGGKASVEGKFNYSFKANSSGSAIIRDSEGKALLAVAQGHMRSRMSEKDLQHFEQMLPALGGSIQQSQRATQAQTKPLASSGKQLEI
jgi:hypothetical protein